MENITLETARDQLNRLKQELEKKTYDLNLRKYQRKRYVRLASFYYSQYSQLDEENSVTTTNLKKWESKESTWIFQIWNAKRKGRNFQKI